MILFKMCFIRRVPRKMYVIGMKLYPDDCPPRQFPTNMDWHKRVVLLVCSSPDGGELFNRDRGPGGHYSWALVLIWWAKNKLSGIPCGELS